MKPLRISLRGSLAAPLLLALLAGGCDRGGQASVGGIEQTKYPGQVTAGGMSSGTLIARTARPAVDATYAGGTPGLAGGSGGTTAGAETAGTVGETGQGPTEGVTQPTGAQPGTREPLGDYGRPLPAQQGTEAPASNVTPQRPAVQDPVKGTP